MEKVGGGARVRVQARDDSTSNVRCHDLIAMGNCVSGDCLPPRRVDLSRLKENGHSLLKHRWSLKPVMNWRTEGD